MIIRDNDWEDVQCNKRNVKTITHRSRRGSMNCETTPRSSLSYNLPIQRNTTVEHSTAEWHLDPPYKPDHESYHASNMQRIHSSSSNSRLREVWGRHRESHHLRYKNVQARMQLRLFRLCTCSLDCQYCRWVFEPTFICAREKNDIVRPHEVCSELLSASNCVAKQKLLGI